MMATITSFHPIESLCSRQLDKGPTLRFQRDMRNVGLFEGRG